MENSELTQLDNATSEVKDVELWKNSTKKIFTGVVIQTVCSLVVSILALVTAVLAVKLMFAATVTTGVITILVGIVGLIGYILYFIGVNKFKNAVNEVDFPAAQKLYVGVLLGLIGAIVTIIPFIGFLGGICGLVGFIFMLIGLNALRKSETFPQLARVGANMLFIIMILGIVVGILNFIPAMAMKIISLICTIAVVVVQILGWKKIKDAVE